MRCGGGFHVVYIVAGKELAESTQHDTLHRAGPAHGETIHLPAPTAWPIVLAFGCMMAAAGLVTSLWVTVFGAVLMVSGAWVVPAGAAARGRTRMCRWWCSR